ncbi:hypothetical protein [Limisphaera sp. VF-2]|jgi:hypothetical protein|uniref:hypothetical protein n=1 Tax=Limisphaera sp. VF-2 TaxID=3400418 RepID=UPI00176C7D54|nr:hypothetical protein [Limisphaera sp.]
MKRTQGVCWMLVAVTGLEACWLFAAETDGHPFSETDPGTAFRNYLAQTPWVKYVSYRRSRSWIRHAVSDTLDKPAIYLPRIFLLERFEAAWQPEGWYCRWFGTEKGHIVLLRGGKVGFKPVLPGLELIEGRNRDYYWALFEDHKALHVSFRTNTAGGQGEYHVMRAFMDAKLLGDLRLGLDPLGWGPLRWRNEVEFEVEPVEGVLAHPGGKGRITRWDERGRPLELVCEAVRWREGSSNVFRVTYTYLSERSFLPWQYVVEEVDFREGLLRHTNYLDKIEFGLDPSAPDGYFPEMFRKRTEPLDRFSITSNGVTHQIIARGFGPGGDFGPEEPLPDLMPWQNWRRWILVGVLGVGVAMVFWGTGKRWWARKHGT